MNLNDHPDALDCTLYRPDEHDPDAEELELGDARIVIAGTFEAPQDWDAADREEYFDGADPACFFIAKIDADFTPEPGDYVAVMQGFEVQMYYLYDLQGEHYVLIREDDLD